MGSVEWIKGQCSQNLRLYGNGLIERAQFSKLARLKREMILNGNPNGDSNYGSLVDLNFTSE